MEKTEYIAKNYEYIGSLVIQARQEGRYLLADRFIAIDTDPALQYSARLRHDLVDNLRHAEAQHG